MLAQVAHALGADTAAPQIAVGGNLATGPTGVAGDDLALFIQDAFGKLVIFGPESLGDFGKAFHRAFSGFLAEKIGYRAIFFNQGGDVPIIVSSSTRSSAISVM